MGKYRGYIAALLIVMVLFGIALKWVSTIPAGTPGLISRKEPQYQKVSNIHLTSGYCYGRYRSKCFRMRKWLSSGYSESGNRRTEEIPCDH